MSRGTLVACIAFSAMQHSLIRGCHHNSFHHPIHACAHSRLDRGGVGVGVCGVGVACPLLLSLLCVSRVDDDVDDVCMDGSNSLIQGSGCHATACACSDALQNSRQVRGHCLRGGTKCSSMGSGAKVWLSDEIRSSLSHQTPESLHVETWAGAQECHPPPPRRVSRSGNFQLGVLQCPSLLVVLFSLLCYLRQAVKLENNWVGYNWRKLTGLGCGFSGVPFKGQDLFSSLAVSGDWVKKGSYHTAWSVPGDSLCSYSYAYGHGPAIGPHTGKRCWVLLSWLWRTIAPLMKPWCAEGEVPTAANLNFYQGRNSRVHWHSDNERCLGGLEWTSLLFR